MSEKVVKNRLSLTENNRMAEEQAGRFVEESEQAYHAQLADIAAHIRDNRERCKIVLLAGPSASGKTTTASKMRKQLEKFDIQSIYVSLDDFYLNRDKVPLLPDGMKDFESIRALDLDCLNRFFSELLKTNKASIPVFNFNTGRRSENTVDIEIDDRFVVIIEGIHALNPMITDGHYDGNFCKIYISPKTEYEANGRIVLNSRNTRLIRRMVRDYQFRSSSPENTMKMWKHVVEGEDLYIRPFRTSADFWIDSFHPYEPMIFHQYLLPLLKQVGPESPYHAKAGELKRILDKFYDMDKSMVPEHSLLREFIG